MSVPDHAETYPAVTLIDVDLALSEYRRMPDAYSLEQLKTTVERLQLFVRGPKCVEDLVPKVA